MESAHHPPVTHRYILCWWRKNECSFFYRGTTEKDDTKRVWFYNMRPDVPSWGKRTPFIRAAFELFVEKYTGGITIDKVKMMVSLMMRSGEP